MALLCIYAFDVGSDTDVNYGWLDFDTKPVCILAVLFGKETWLPWMAINWDKLANGTAFKT